ncbi:carbohydrate-binding protein [Actinomadura luteofluorescens]|uniref:carbohydrate-binding protein n=1 Tax=Actinomadura luteofluorescens TaxID=46163 RepID=UPI003D90C3EA
MHRRGLRVAVLAAGALGLAGAQGIAVAQPGPAGPARPAPRTAAPFSAATAADVPPAMLKAMRRDLPRARGRPPAEARAFAKAAGVDAAEVTVKRSAIRPRTYYDLRGGDAYYMNGSGRCSIGFSVTRGGTPGFITAGHCGQPGTTTSGYNQVQQGSFQGSSFPGNDYAWVATNGNWSPVARVNGYGSVQDPAVSGSTVAQTGSPVCRSGSTTGWHCGTVQQLNTSVTYPQGTVSGVTQTNVCAEPGDSGGSFISGSQAQGTTSGGSGDCRSGGTTFFQPVNEGLQVYGLTLYTGTSNPPDDPPDDPPSGTWAAGTVYQVGDVVTYNGVGYKCIQSHQAQPGWTPENVPALWQRA